MTADREPFQGNVFSLIRARWKAWIPSPPEGGNYPIAPSEACCGDEDFHGPAGGIVALERCVIGALLMGNDAIVISLMGNVRAEDFTVVPYRLVFETIEALRAERRTPNVGLVAKRLGAAFRDADGPGHLESLVEQADARLAGDCAVSIAEHGALRRGYARPNR